MQLCVYSNIPAKDRNISQEHLCVTNTLWKLLIIRSGEKFLDACRPSCTVLLFGPVFVCHPVARLHIIAKVTPTHPSTSPLFSLSFLTQKKEKFILSFWRKIHQKSCEREVKNQGITSSSSSYLIRCKKTN